MRETSEIWKQLVAEKSSAVKYKFIIDGVEYTDADEVEHSVQSELFEELGIGNATISQLSLSLYAEVIPRGAKVERFVQLQSEDRLTASEWLPAGVFYTSRRGSDDGLWKIEAYDAMRKAKVVWSPNNAHVFPMPMSDAVTEFCRILDVELDDRTILSAAYTIDYPANDYTIRNVLQYIAAAHGGNWIITPEGKLRLVPLVPTGDPHAIGLDLTELEDNSLCQPVSRVILLADSENYYEAGNDSGLTIEADCPYATAEMAAAVLSAVQGYEYQQYTASAVRIDPAAELGDPVIVGDMTSLIVSMTDDGLGFPDISAPGEEEAEDEFVKAGPMAQKIDRKIAETRSFITKTAEEINLRVEDAEGNLSQIEQTVGSITLSVKSSSGTDGQTYASITLRVGDKSTTEQILLNGNVDVSGQLSADALYAALGNIADLTVDKFSTSRRIKKYLAGDTSDDNHIQAQDEELMFVSGVYAGDYEQATSPSGGPLYWESDPDADGVVLGADGYPYKDGVRIFTTTAETDWPVYVFTYDELVKARFAFEQWGDIYTPVLTMGAGNEQGLNKGYMVKSADGLEIVYKANTGADIGMRLGTGGYMDLTGLRKPTNIAFTNEGFTVTVDGGLSESFSYVHDASGNITSIVDSTGHVTTISGVSV